jgi:hypothetical protein
MVGPNVIRGRSLRKLLSSVLVAASIAVAAGCKPGPPKLLELDSVEALQARFNRDSGKTRVVLLLSPT